MKYDHTGNWILIGRYWVRLSDGYRLPAIQGGTAANFGQNDKYAFGDDDGSESAHSLDTENTNRTAQVADVTFMIRIQCEEVAGGNATYTHALFAQKNGTGGFTEVTTARSDGLKIANDTQGRADDENTTERLTYGGAGAWQAGKYDDGQTQQGTTSFKCDTEYTELEFAIQIDSANASNGDYWELRGEQSDGTDYNFYPGSYPTVTASITALPEASVSSGITLGESTAVTPLVLADVAKSDGITIADTLVDISVTGGAEPDRDITGVTDNITIAEAITAQADRTLSVSDGLTLADSPSLGPLVLGDVAVSDGIAIGESVSATLDDLVLAVSDGITITDTVVNVTIPGEAGPTLAVDLGIDNLNAWVQGVVVYG